MTQKPTRFDKAQFDTLTTDAERHEYLIALHTSLRDEMQTTLNHYRGGGAVTLPADFTRADLIDLMTQQIAGQNEILKRLS